MKKTFFTICLCSIFGWSCISGDMQVKKDSCQKVCDSLELAQTAVWTVEGVEPAIWKGIRISVTIVGKVPVTNHIPYEAPGSILSLNNRQRILTDYTGVPKGAKVVQKPKYAPKRIDNNYQPQLLEYYHCIIADSTEYDLKHLKVL